MNFCDLSKVLGFVAESLKKYLGSSIANLPKYERISLWFNHDNLHFCNKSSNIKENPVIFYKILTILGDTPAHFVCQLSHANPQLFMGLIHSTNLGHLGPLTSDGCL